VLNNFNNRGGAYQELIDFYKNFTVEQTAEYLMRAGEWGQSKEISAELFLNK